MQRRGLRLSGRRGSPCGKPVDCRQKRGKWRVSPGNLYNDRLAMESKVRGGMEGRTTNLPPPYSRNLDRFCKGGMVPNELYHLDVSSTSISLFRNEIGVEYQRKTQFPWQKLWINRKLYGLPNASEGKMPLSNRNAEPTKSSRLKSLHL